MDFSDNDNNKEELMQLFQGESEDIIERIFSNLFSLEKTPTNKELIAAVYRDLHSLKGAVRMVGYNNIQMIIHKMEDIFDAINSSKMQLDQNIVKLMSHSLEMVSKYIQDSIRNDREIIDDEFRAILSNLEYIVDIELADMSSTKNQQVVSGTAPDIPILNIPGLDIPGFTSSPQSQEEDINPDSISIIDIPKSGLQPSDSSDLASHQEEINTGFNKCFEIIDSIVPEEESQDIVILKEEVQKIYEFFKNADLYEVKSSLENIITKIDFVMNASNTLTISEILELRNELSSAVAKFTTSCISVENKGFSFFDVAEKMSMLQGSSVYTTEIKDDINK